MPLLGPGPVTYLPPTYGMAGTTPGGEIEQPVDVGSAALGRIPAVPFTYGAGGRRLTPEDIAAQRKQAQAMAAAGMDFSPVGHWTQGLARVAQGLVGGLEESRLDKADAANQAHGDEVLRGLMMGGGAGDSAALLTAATDQTLPEDVRKVAQWKWQQQNKAPVNNDTINDFNWYKSLSPEDRTLYEQMRPVYRQGADGQFYRVDTGGQTQAEPVVIGSTLPPGWTTQEEGGS